LDIFVVQAEKRDYKEGCRIDWVCPAFLRFRFGIGRVL